jgi:hypothetical protein
VDQVGQFLDFERIDPFEFGANAIEELFRVECGSEHGIP